MASMHKGACFCGAVQIEVSASRRAWAIAIAVPAVLVGRAVNAFTLWKTDAVRVVSGAEHIAKFQKTAMSERQYAPNAAGI